MSSVMNRSLIAVVAALAICLPVRAQKLDWKLGFDYLFDNSEFDSSKGIIDPSGTFHAVRLSPEAGLIFAPGEDVHHRVMLGVNLFKDLGTQAGPEGVLGEVTCYYRMDAALSSGELCFAAGCFPRAISEGDYHGAFFDETYLFEDNNLDGFLLKYRTESLYAELALDWMGKHGDDAEPARRERFSILSSGLWNFCGPLSLGWTGNFYHFACSQYEKNVIDNHTLYPYLHYSPKVYGLDELSVDFGPVLSYQRDRSLDERPVLPWGLECNQKIERKGWLIDNRIWWGYDMQPYRFLGESLLYPGEPVYHLPVSKPFWADCMLLAYRHPFGSSGFIEAGVVLHFGQKVSEPELSIPVFRGWQQVLAINFNLEKGYRKPRRKAAPRTLGELFGI